MTMRNLILLTTLAFTTACTPFAYSASPPTPQHLSVVYTPALSWMELNLNRCAQDQPEISITVEVRPVTSIEVGAADVTLVFGALPEGIRANVVQLGWEQVTVIANAEIPATQLELPDLQKLYTSLAPVYQPWTYPDNSELHAIFAELILKGIEPSPHTKIAPNPETMQAAINEASSAVGFIPISSVSAENIQIIPLPEEISAQMLMPILALSTAEPKGNVLILLGCLTDSLNLD